ncbi:hypothetical protein A8139_04455 [Marinomonas primoryensis]|uniref:HEPN domain-containing protein n=1 Tax=Marinomonas primoryensis TaxID=178399 RepID=A0A2Z4PQC4_9GAMM|nr:hypothetical protein [Marinomonas primoryensis]AWX99338.1 hypothetical protein A8139_04455 [Marinomonas primoryensis]
MVDKTWNIFKSLHSGRFNACVGENSLHDLKTYSNGYMEASILLLNTVLDNRLIGQMDTLVHPILYSARHAIELTIKYTLFELNKCDLKTEEAKISGHNLCKLWKLFEAIAQQDSRLRNCYENIDPILKELDAADRDAQDFRYPVGNAKNGTPATQTLAGKRIVDLVTVREMITYLEEQLKSLQELSVIVSIERNLGTYTQDLNRDELKKLAIDCGKGTPPYYPEAKKTWQKNYSLSGHGFGRAMKKIRSHREFAGYAGVEKDLIALPIDLLDKIVQFKLIDLQTSFSSNRQLGGKLILSVNDLVDSIEIDTIASKAYDELKEHLTAPIIAELETLYYLSYLFEYSENYVLNFEQKLSCISDDKGCRDSFLHVFSKTNLLQNVISSLNLVGQNARSKHYQNQLTTLEEEFKDER